MLLLLLLAYLSWAGEGGGCFAAVGLPWLCWRRWYCCWWPTGTLAELEKENRQCCLLLLAYLSWDGEGRRGCCCCCWLTLAAHLLGLEREEAGLLLLLLATTLSLLPIRRQAELVTSAISTVCSKLWKKY